MLGRLPYARDPGESPLAAGPVRRADPGTPSAIARGATRALLGPESTRGPWRRGPPSALPPVRRRPVAVRVPARSPGAVDTRAHDRTRAPRSGGRVRARGEQAPRRDASIPLPAPIPQSRVVGVVPRLNDAHRRRLVRPAERPGLPLRWARSAARYEMLVQGQPL